MPRGLADSERFAAMMAPCPTEKASHNEPGDVIHRAEVVAEKRLPVGAIAATRGFPGVRN